MPSRFVSILLLCAVFVAAASARADGARTLRPPLEEFDCPADEYGDLFVAAAIERKCAWLHTAERRGGRPIYLAVTLLSPGAKSVRPPTVFVHGGPGMGFSNGWWMLAMADFAKGGEVIMFDQRGVGWSGPRLCPHFDEDNPALDHLPQERLTQQALAELSKCLAELADETEAGEKVDLAAYGTQATVRDMETLRRALGIAKWNVYGVSYGTTVTLAYIAAHPERTRAAVVDSVYPPEMLGLTSSLPDFVASLFALNTLCEADDACKSEVGDLTKALSTAIESLEAAPLAIEITHPIRYEREKRHISGATLLAIVEAKMLVTSEWHLVPLIVRDALKREASPLLARTFEDQIGLLADSSYAVWMATECRERAPFDDRREIDRHMALWPDLARVSSLPTLFAMCDRWPVKDSAALTPENTPVPTLVIAGEWDPVTPATHAERTARILGVRSQYVIAQKAAHAPSFLNPCMEGIVARFLDDPDRRIAGGCDGRAPRLTTRLVPFDARAAMAWLWPYSTASMAPAMVIALGFAATLWWPASWLRARPRSPSSLWFFAAAAIALVWLAWIVRIVSAAGYDAFAWLSYGVPAEAWPGHSLLVFMPLLTLGGLAAWGKELMHGKIAAGQFVHRTIVATGLIGAYVMLDSIGLMPRTLGEIGDDLARLASF